ncbi:MAG: biopolymer transporter ExbD [Henriciella sp.]|nr:biopolymer transporter ExbD [Henriciella sp.]
MSLKRVRRRRKASITSLIDVIFLLLLFFMLASTFSKFSEIDIAVANASGIGQSSTDVASLHIQSDRVFCNETETPDVELVSRLSELGATGTSGVRISLADDVSTQRLVDVLSLVKQVPGLTIQIEEPS